MTEGEMDTRGFQCRNRPVEPLLLQQRVGFAFRGDVVRRREVAENSRQTAIPAGWSPV